LLTVELLLPSLSASLRLLLLFWFNRGDFFDWGCLVPPQNFFTLSHWMFRHMHGVLNVDEKNKYLYRLR
jgi:hypothetical protein